MTPELLILATTAASIGFLHTLLGPDHYLPFIVMAKARGWSKTRALMITALCGLGHVAGSVLLGLIGIGFGIAVGSLEAIESVRGDWAAWALIAFGLTYCVWGVKKAIKDKPHEHTHNHGDGRVHSHEHTHHTHHAHVHPAPERNGKSGLGLTPWALFMIFVLGPCELLIPLLMYPAAQSSWMGMLGVAGIFGAATLATMTAIVALALFGLQNLSFAPLERFSHALAGGTVAASGSAIVFLGL